MRTAPTAAHEPLRTVQALPHDGDPASTIASLASQIAAPPQAVCIANVTGSAHEQALSQAVQQHWHCTPSIARSSAECGGLKSGYAEVGRLGVDRWLAMLAVWTETRAAFNVASAGTAITFDAVDANGKIEARAWCEAVVQRMPEYVSPEDKSYVAPAALSSETNRVFGRRFVIVSFRWLSSTEV